VPELVRLLTRLARLAWLVGRRLAGKLIAKDTYKHLLSLKIRGSIRNAMRRANYYARQLIKVSSTWPDIITTRPFRYAVRRMTFEAMFDGD
jgi:hypothetical protein